MNGKHAHLTNLLDRAVAIATRSKPTFDLLGRQASDRLRIVAGASDRYRIVVDIRAKNLHAQSGTPSLHFLAQNNSDRIHLLPSGASWNPDAKLILCFL